MKIGIHGKKFSGENTELIQSILDRLKGYPCEIYISDDYIRHFVKNNIAPPGETYSSEDSPDWLDAIITLGGDGTLLEAITHVGSKGTPILGINTGRMGFLATTAKEDIDAALKDLFNENYTFDKRSLLELHSDRDIFLPDNYALNDFTILKKDTSSMITVSVFVNGELLNAYWADGVIVATPTGSTGYSLSCGGPLIMPGADSFVITPVSPHNLTARPIIVPDDSEITFKIEARSKKQLVSLDSRFWTVDNSINLTLRKASFTANLIRLMGNSYFKTIRQKLSWGLDIRN